MMAMVDFRVVDTAVGSAANDIGVAKLPLRSFHSCNSLSLIDSHSEPSSSSSSSGGVLRISSVSSNAVNAVAAPPAKSITCRVPRRTLLRRKRRTKRRLTGDDSSENVGDEGFFYGDGGDGPFGGDDGGFGGSGGGGNFNRFGEGHDWDESSSSHSDPAFDFVYEVLSWIMLSNCLHYAFQKIVRWAAGGIVGPHIGKVAGKLVRMTGYILLHRNL